MSVELSINFLYISLYKSQRIIFYTILFQCVELIFSIVICMDDLLHLYLSSSSFFRKHPEFPCQWSSVFQIQSKRPQSSLYRCPHNRDAIEQFHLTLKTWKSPGAVKLFPYFATKRNRYENFTVETSIQLQFFSEVRF